MDYVTADIVFSQAIPDLFAPGITTSTCCADKGEVVLKAKPVYRPTFDISRILTPTTPLTMMAEVDDILYIHIASLHHEKNE